MTTTVVCVKPEHDVRHCMALMTEQRRRHLPVPGDDGLVGLLSIGDLVKEVLSHHEPLIRDLATKNGSLQSTQRLLGEPSGVVAIDSAHAFVMREDRAVASAVGDGNQSDGSIAIALMAQRDEAIGAAESTLRSGPIASDSPTCGSLTVPFS